MGLEKREHIKPLTGLRFLAALLVFVHHLPCIVSYTANSLPVGAAGVAFFFVLSGFILTYVYEGKIDSWKSIRKFWFARWARIWPVHLVTLLACAFFVVGMSNSFSSSEEIKKFLLNLFLVQTWVPELSWGMGFNHVSWSIATEFFFYAVFPLLILLPIRFLRTSMIVLFVICIGAIAIGQNWLNGIADPTAHTLWEKRLATMIHINPLMRLCEFMAGMLIGHSYLRSKSKHSLKPSKVLDSLTEFAMILVTVAFLFVWAKVFVWSSTKPEMVLWAKWIQITAVAIIFLPVIYICATRKGLLSWLLSRKPVVYLGEISFAFYMVHQLVIRVLRSSISGFWGYGFWFTTLTTFIISIAISAIVFELIEMPLRNFLLMTYRKRWKQGLLDFNSSCLRFLGSKVVVAATISILATVLVVNSESKVRLEQRFAYSQYLPVIEDSILNSENLDFGGDAVLRAATVAQKLNGGLEVKLVWEKKTFSDRHRFIHVVDRQDRIVCNPVIVQQQIDFRRSPLHRKFVEVIELNTEQLKGGVKLGIGLYGRESGVAKVIADASNNRRIGMGGARLDLINYKTYPSGILAFDNGRENGDVSSGKIVR